VPYPLEFPMLQKDVTTETEPNPPLTPPDYVFSYALGVYTVRHVAMPESTGSYKVTQEMVEAEGWEAFRPFFDKARESGSVLVWRPEEAA